MEYFVGQHAHKERHGIQRQLQVLVQRSKVDIFVLQTRRQPHLHPGVGLWCGLGGVRLVIGCVRVGLRWRWRWARGDEVLVIQVNILYLYLLISIYGDSEW